MKEAPSTYPALPLEDEFSDVVAKALRGHELSWERLAGELGQDPEGFRAAFSSPSPLLFPLWERVAERLSLHPKKLQEAACQQWRPPSVPAIPGLHQFVSPFRAWTVNAWLVHCPVTKEGWVIDTGTDASELLQFVEEQAVYLQALAFTHTVHPDHTSEVDRIGAATGLRRLLGPEGEPSVRKSAALRRDQVYSLGTLEIEIRSTPGHSPDGVTLVVAGLARPVALVGDALYAGSLGAPLDHYGKLLSGVRREIFSLPDDTLLCPGHGPVTTVAQEKAHNPFF
ncbi:MAG: MBL fold metallo-hydrolase [Verrucomicrobiota bacterium]